jgi:hypothetical protein
VQSRPLSARVVRPRSVRVKVVAVGLCVAVLGAGRAATSCDIPVDDHPRPIPKDELTVPGR